MHPAAKRRRQIGTAHHSLPADHPLETALGCDRQSVPAANRLLFEPRPYMGTSESRCLVRMTGGASAPPTLGAPGRPAIGRLEVDTSCCVVVRALQDAACNASEQVVGKRQELLNLGVAESIVHVPAFRGSCDEPAIRQAAQMVRGVRLRQTGGADNLVNGQRPVSQGFKDPESRLVGKSAKQLRLVLARWQTPRILFLARRHINQSA